jgi:hypothetical protein
MRALALVLLAALPLAACDAPDPAAFHHALRSDAMTGSRLLGQIGASEIGSVDQHGFEQMQTAGTVNNKNKGF